MEWFDVLLENNKSGDRAKYEAALIRVPDVEPDPFDRLRAVPFTNPIRILSYNIQHGADAKGALDLDGIERVLRDSRADVICLQEVDVNWSARSEWVDQVGVLAKRLGFEHSFAPIYSLDPPAGRTARRAFGLAVLTRYAVSKADNHPLSRISSLEREKGVQVFPGFQEVEIDIEGRRLRVFNTQLSWLDADLRLKEADEMLALIGQSPEPVILAGDMNGTPDSPEVRRVCERLVDTFAAQGTGDGFTYPADRPERRIDYIFASRDLLVASCSVLDTTASDHRPVVAEVRHRPAGDGSNSDRRRS